MSKLTVTEQGSPAPNPPTGQRTLFADSTGWMDRGATGPAVSLTNAQAATTPEMQAGTETALRDMSPANVKEAIDALGGGLPTATRVGSSTQINTGSESFILATGMTITPVAGNYLVWFSGYCRNSGEGNDVKCVVFVDGVEDSDSRQKMESAHVQQDLPFCCVAKVVVNGSQAIEGRWRVNATTGSLLRRVLTILRVA